MSKKEKLEKVKGKGKGFLDEFKEFIMRGNVMDMAVGIIIGSAFAGIVDALTTDIINPLINGIGGAKVGGVIKIYGGQVITAIINFLIMALVLFLILKSFNKLAAIGKKEKEEEVALKTDEAILLEEIRDLLKKQSK